MNNTIPNVPRELLERIAELLSWKGGISKHLDDVRWAYGELRALLSAPSPAGVDGLETIGYATESELAQLLDPTMPTGKYVRIGLDHPTCWKEDAPCEHLVALCVLSDAQAIIDGLRGEVAAQRIKTCTALKERNDAREERDQQAQRIGELEGLLRDCYPGCGLTARQTQSIRERIDAAMSAGKERE